MELVLLQLEKFLRHANRASFRLFNLSAQKHIAKNWLMQVKGLMLNKHMLNLFCCNACKLLLFVWLKVIHNRRHCLHEHTLELC